MWTRALRFTQMGIESKQEALFSAFWTAFHPLSLGHKLDSFISFGDKDYFRFLFNFNDFFATVFGEEDTCNSCEFAWSSLACVSQYPSTDQPQGRHCLYLCCRRSRSHSQYSLRLKRDTSACRSRGMGSRVPSSSSSSSSSELILSSGSEIW